MSERPQPPACFELVAQSDWYNPARRGPPRLFSWRSMLALALRDVPIRPILTELWPTLRQMADQVSRQLVACVAEGKASTPPGFAQWLALWRDQFSHWHDPVRSLVIQHCCGDDAAQLSGHFTLLDGFSFADFVLAASVGCEQRDRLARRLRDEAPPESLMPDMMHRAAYEDAPAMNWACAYLYASFQHEAPFATSPALAEAITWADVTNIYAERGLPDGQSADVPEIHA